jgi:hypothetical protein
MQFTDSANSWSCAWKKAHVAAVMVMTYVGGSIVPLSIVALLSSYDNPNVVRETPAASPGGSTIFGP